MTPLPTSANGGPLAAAAVVEDHEGRRVFGTRGHAEQAAEPLLADPGLVPDLDGDPRVRGHGPDLLGQPAGHFSDGGVLARSRARLIACPTISPRRTCSSIGCAGSSVAPGPTRMFRVPNGCRLALGLAQTRSAGAGDDALDQGRDPTGDGAIDGIGKSQRDALARLARKPLGQRESGGERRARIELLVGPRPTISTEPAANPAGP